MTEFIIKFAPLAERMRAVGMPELAIETLGLYFRRLLAGATGEVSESEIEPVSGLADAETLGVEPAEIGRQALSQTVLIKLNGGLGTSMGLERAKSLLVVKKGLTFLDIIARQALAAGVPLLLMNSFATRRDSLALLDKYPGLAAFGLPRDFLQHKIPKICRKTLRPVNYPEAPELEWCPPGHGDIYPALVTSGVLAALRRAGYRYAFVSNADNLGAVLEPAILGHFVSREVPFMMEVADRTPADRKGGHLARRLSDGGLLLREAAQCPAAEQAAFQDIERYRYFNTNSLWLDLLALEEIMAACDNLLELPLICNRKPVDPCDALSTPVFQLETAMGAAIEVFAGAQALRVSRSRFAPVKTTEDLLAVRSDAYRLNDDFTVTLAPGFSRGPQVTLDPDFYRLLGDFERRFPGAGPSLSACQSLKVKGDITFTSGITVCGQVAVANRGPEPLTLPAGLILAAGSGKEFEG
ncbi:MAG: UTP--glucose-1-phosphate uridylyltransferase [Deltaproteobacteria bacterium]|nr:UTP--glucose-1-phosphate uridylyltransferase [Deltaproteobacteria bacterium]